MPNEKLDSQESASEQILKEIEQNLEPGGVRDLWLSLRKELNEGGSEGVRTYLASEYERRKAIVKNAQEELTNQLEETA